VFTFKKREKISSPITNLVFVDRKGNYRPTSKHVKTIPGVKQNRIPTQSALLDGQMVE
jgi:hypothetical protein